MTESTPVTDSSRGLFPESAEEVLTLATVLLWLLTAILMAVHILGAILAGWTSSHVTWRLVLVLLFGHAAVGFTSWARTRVAD